MHRWDSYSRRASAAEKLIKKITSRDTHKFEATNKKARNSNEMILIPQKDHGDKLLSRDVSLKNHSINKMARSYRSSVEELNHCEDEPRE